MLFCSNCGAELKEDEVFCSVCGTKVEEISAPAEPETMTSETTEESSEEPVFCPECGAKNLASDAFCQECGAPMNGEKQPVLPVSPQPDPAGVVGGSGKKPPKALIIGGVAVAVLAVAALILPNLGKGSSASGKENGVVYLKDNSLYRYDGKKVLELTDRVAAEEDSWAGNLALSHVKYSEDGNRAYYMEKLKEDQTGTLYTMDLKKQSEKNDTAEKISSNVDSFRIVKDRVFYLKKSGDQRNLYMTDRKEENKLATDVHDYCISEDGQKILWVNQEKNIYYTDLKAGIEKEKLASDASVLGYSKDLETVFYSDSDDTLYCLKSFVKEKVASDANFIASTKGGQAIYYSKQNESFDIMNYLEDDMASQDAALTEPNVNNYKKYSQSAFWGTTYTTDYDAYQRDLEAYEEKLERDELRKELKNNTTDGLQFIDVYLYDGKESTLLMENVLDGERISSYTNKSEDDISPAAIVYSIEGVDIPSVRLSELSSLYDFTSKFYQTLREEKDSGLPAKLLEGGMALDMTYYLDCVYTADQKNAILYRGVVEENSGDWGFTMLEKMKYSEKGLEEPVIVDDDFEGASAYDENGFDQAVVLNGELYYFKDYDYEKEEGTVYRNGEEIADDVYRLSAVDDHLYLMGDRSSKNYTCTLSEYKNGKIEEIAEEVYRFKAMKDGSIVALMDYSSKRGEGDLYTIKNGKKELVDEDVKEIGGAY